MKKSSFIRKLTALLLSLCMLFSTAADVIAAASTLTTEESVSNVNANSPLSPVTLLVGDLKDPSRPEHYVYDDIKDMDLEEVTKYFTDHYALGIASQFSVFMEDYFIPKNSDVEGRMAIGSYFSNADNVNKEGDYNIGKGNYGISGNTGSGAYPLDILINAKDYARVIWGANTGAKGTGLSGINFVPGGDDPSWYYGVAGTEPQLNIAFDATGTADGGKSAGEYLSDEYSAYKDYLYGAQGDLIDFDAQFTMLNQRSKNIADIDNQFELDLNNSGYVSLWQGSEAVTIATLRYKGNSGGEQTLNADVVHLNLDDPYFSQTIDVNGTPTSYRDFIKDANIIRYEGIPRLETPRMVVNSNENESNKGGATSTTGDVGYTEWYYSYIVVNDSTAGNVYLGTQRDMGTWTIKQYTSIRGVRYSNGNVVDEEYAINISQGNFGSWLAKLKGQLYTPENNVFKGGDGDGIHNGYKLADALYENGTIKSELVDGTDYMNNHPGVTSILLNFPNATQVIVRSNLVGTILAPNAHVTDLKFLLGITTSNNPPANYYNQYYDGKYWFTDDANPHISGAVIGQSFEGNVEFGYRPYTGPRTIVGEEPDEPVVIPTSLTLSKKITEVDGVEIDEDKEFEFTIELNLPADYTDETELTFEATDENDEVIVGGVTFTKDSFSGIWSATVTLKHGESITIAGLPVGTKYRITEANDADYELDTGASTDMSGEIDMTDLDASAEAWNKRKTGELDITKTVTHSDGSDADDEDKAQEFSFTLTLTEADGITPITCELTYTIDDGEEQTLTATNGVYAFTLKHGETIHITGIPAGATYTVEENLTGDQSDYGAQLLNATGTVGTGAPVTVSAVNRRTIRTGEVEFDKTVTGSGRDENQKFEFTVYLYEADGETPLTGEYEYILSETATVSAASRALDALAAVNATTNPKISSGGTVELRHGQKVTILGLPVGTKYEIVETAAEGYTTTVSGETIGDPDRTATGVVKDIDTDGKSEVHYTNDKGTGKLKLSKTVTTEFGGDKAKKFTFKVTLTDDDGNVLTDITGDYGDMTFIHGVATVELADGEVALAEGLPIGAHYTVEEVSDENYEVTVGANGYEGIIVNNDDASVAVPEAEFTNTRKTGDLTVKKTVERSNGSAPEAGDVFSFKVTLSDTTINGTYGDMEFTGGVAEFTLKNGEYATATGLPAGITYTVEETDSNGYTSEYDGSESGTIAASGEIEVNVVNKKTVAGDLIVTKTVAHSDGTALDADDLIKEFSFKVTIYKDEARTEVDEDFNGVYGDMEFTEGVAEFTLKNGENKIATDLPEGVTYTVEETSVDGFTPSSEGASGEIIDGDTATADFTNTKLTGGLTVSKIVAYSDNSTVSDEDNAQRFNFTVTLIDTTINGTYGDMGFVNGVAEFTLSASDAPKTATGLPAGITYTVEETNSDGFTVSYSGSTTDGRGTIPTNDSENNELAEVVVTNTKTIVKTGSLTVFKTVANSDGSEVRAEDKDKVFTFTVTLYKDGKKFEDFSGTEMGFVNGVATFTLKDGESLTAAEIPEGVTYSVVETRPDGYTVSYGDNKSTGEITDGGDDTIAVTNTKSVGDLIVDKTVVSDEENDKNEEFTFTVTLSDSSINGDYGDMTFTNGVATFKLKHGETKKATGLPAGTMYIVRETGNGEYTVTSSGAVGNIVKNDGSEAAEAKQAVAAFTNTKETEDEDDATSDLTVEKYVSGGSTTKAFTFTLTLTEEDGTTPITEVAYKTSDGEEGTKESADGIYTFALKDGDVITFTELPVGAKYEVVETDDENYIQTKSGDSGEITDGSNTAVFVNVVRRGALTVSKTVTGTAGETGKPFTFTVTVYEDAEHTKVYKNVDGTYGDMTFEEGVAEFTLKHGEHKTASGLPSGAYYTVVETNNEGYTMTSTGETGVISEKVNASADFVNNKEAKLGDLIVHKTVKYNDNSELSTADANKKFTFTVTLYEDEAHTKVYESVDGTYGDMVFSNGVATVRLAHDENATAEGLPAGIFYTVTESNNAGYEMSATDDEGTIPEGGEAKAEFVNSKDKETEPETWSLSVKKTITNENPDTEKYFTFKVRLYEDKALETPYELDGVYGDMAFAKGVATFTLRHDQTKVATGLPVMTEDGEQIYYSVSEVPSSSYDTEGNNQNGPAGGDVSIEIKNTKIEETEEPEEPEEKLGNLTVRKTVSGSAQHNIDEEFGFKVELSDKTISGTYGDITFENGYVEFTLKPNESKTAIGLPAGITYTVTETTPNQNGYKLTSKNDQTGKIEDGKTKTVTFNNHKDEEETGPEAGTGNLRVTKLVDGTAQHDVNTEFEFEVRLSDEEINGDYGDMTFENGVATFTLKPNEHKTARDLPVGITYTVTETDSKGYEVTYDGEVADNAYGEIVENGTVGVVVTNFMDAPEEPDEPEEPTPEPKFGGLSVTKTVEHEDGTALDNGEDEIEFKFTVTIYEDEANTIVCTDIDGTYGDIVFSRGVSVGLTLTHGQTKTATELPAGLYYTVEETPTEGYTSDSERAAGTIEDGKVIAVTYTNTKEKEDEPAPEPKFGKLSVTKTVVNEDGTAPDSTISFKFVLTLEDADGKSITPELSYTKGTESGKLTANADGEYEFTLKHDETIVIDGIPAGATYTLEEKLTEAQAEEYTSNIGKVAGEIVKDVTAEVEVINTKKKTEEEDEPKEEYGSLTVTKTVVNEDGTAPDSAVSFEFVLTLKDADGKSITPELSYTKGEESGKLPANADGEYEFTLKHDETIVIDGIPAGATYTLEEKLTEAQAEEYTSNIGKVAGEITKDVTAEVEVINTKKKTEEEDGPKEEYGSLTVTKTVRGNAANYYQAFQFTVILSDSSINGLYGQMYFENGVAFFSLMHGQSITATGLPAGITYTVIENNSAGYVVSSTGATGTIFADGTRVAAFTNTKNTTTTWTPTTPTTPETPEEEPEEEIVIETPVEPGETDDDDVNIEDNEPSEDGAAPDVADKPEDSNPGTGSLMNALLPIAALVIAGLAVITRKLRRA